MDYFIQGVKKTFTCEHIFCQLLSQKRYWSCICVLGISMLPLLTIFLLDFGTGLTVWYFIFFILLSMRLKFMSHPNLKSCQIRKNRLYHNCIIFIRAIDLETHIPVQLFLCIHWSNFITDTIIHHISPL